MAQDPGLEPPVRATPPEDVPPMAPTVPGTTPPDLPESTIARITSAVTQAVMESLQMPQHNPAPSPMESRTREVPLQGISVADAQGQGPVAAAMENLTGEVVELGVIRPHLMASSVGISNFNSVSIPIDAQVSPKIKAKIWSNEFIDFGLLINPQVGDTRYNLSLGTSEGSVPTLALEPTTKAKAIHNIEVWTTAFQVFVGVYTSKYPLEAPALMKYGEVVRDLAARGGNWQFYDTQFRFLRYTHAHEMPWGSTHWELWIRAQNFSQAKPKSQSGSQRAGYSCLKGFAASFTRALVVLVHALLSMLVLSVQVGRNILHTAVIFVPPVQLPIFVPPVPLPIFNPLVSKPQPCPELPTPVLIERMLPLLCGYDVHVVSLLHNGFTLGFPLHFSGERISFCSVLLL